MADDSSNRTWGYYFALLRANVTLMPTLASALTVVAYVLWQDRFALLIGAGAALIVWLVVALLCFITESVTAERANADTYGDFHSRLTQLKEILKDLPADREHEPQVEQAKAHIALIKDELPKDDSRWVRGYGYDDLWRALHAAEEALIAAGIPKQDAILAGQHDESRLVDSKIPQNEKLLLRLRNALYALSPSTMRYFLGRFDPPDKKLAESSAHEARGVVALVRRQINEFNDDRYHALLNTRNMYLDILPLIGLAVHLVLVIAIAAKVGRSQIEAAAAFYVAGVVTGFLWVWYRETKIERTVQDFGLATANLLRPLVISGAAAIIAVLVIPVLIPRADPSSGGATATPTPAASQAKALVIAMPQRSSTATIAGSTWTSLPSSGVIERAPAPVLSAQDGETSGDTCDSQGAHNLECIFSLKHNLQGLLFAFIFGATPEALLTMFKLQGQKYVDEIKSTEAGEGSSTA